MTFSHYQAGILVMLNKKKIVVHGKDEKEQQEDLVSVTIKRFIDKRNMMNYQFIRYEL